MLKNCSWAYTDHSNTLKLKQTVCILTNKLYFERIVGLNAYLFLIGIDGSVLSAQL